MPGRRGRPFAGGQDRLPLGQGVRRIGARERVDPLGLAGLFLGLIAFPLFKVQVIDHLPAVIRYGETGRGAGLIVWSGLYIGAEVLIAAICIASIYREGRTVADIGLVVPRSRGWWTCLSIVFAVAVAIIVLRHVDAVTIMGRPGQDYGALAARNTWQRAAIVISSAFVVPIEEIIWRGFAITRLQRLGLPTWVAVALPALAFGYFHGGTLDTLWISAAIAIGVSVLSVVFLRTRSLAWPILMHFGWNALLVSLTPTPVAR